MRLLLDECLSTRLTPLLARFGHDVTHVNDLGLDSHPDQDVLDAARVHGRVLVSADTDFGELLVRQDTALPSLVLFRQGNRTPEHQREAAGPDRWFGPTGLGSPCPASSTQFDEPIARLDQADDFIDQRIEPGQQCGASCVADTYPHDCGSITAEGGHVREVLILGHDDRSMFERVAPQVAIG